MASRIAGPRSSPRNSMNLSRSSSIIRLRSSTELWYSWVSGREVTSNGVGFLNYGAYNSILKQEAR
ncbi:hypothetical protein U1Q18_052217, partial [Sarracenia purpurea var. burkii]